MPFRTSPHIDFDTDTVSTAPMTLIGKLPRPWSLDQKIDVYECMVDVWQLGASVAMLRQIESHQPPSAWSHSAYALLSVVFSYFEMIGKSLNPSAAASGTAGNDFNVGFCDVYPAFNPPNGNFSDKIVQPSGPAALNPDIQPVVRFRDRVRNGIYHLGYTKGAVILHNQKPIDFEEKTVPDPSNSTANVTLYMVNPHSLVRTIVNHFPGFIKRLRDTSNTVMRTKFESFFDQFIAS